MTKEKRGARGMGRVYRRGDVYWIRYFVRGEERRESALQVTGDGSEESAKRLLRKRLVERDEGQLPARSAGTTLSILRTLVKADYGARGLRSIATALDAFKHCVGYFGLEASASAITYDVLLRYVQHRREVEGAAPATVRNELVYLRRGMVLARKANRLSELPEFPHIEVDNARMGFFEDDELDRLLAALREDFAGHRRRLRVPGVDRMAEAGGTRPHLGRVRHQSEDVATARSTRQRKGTTAAALRRASRARGSPAAAPEARLRARAAERSARHRVGLLLDQWAPSGRAHRRRG